MYEKFGQFIDGKWQQAEKKETYDGRELMYLEKLLT